MCGNWTEKSRQGYLCHSATRWRIIRPGTSFERSGVGSIYPLIAMPCDPEARTVRSKKLYVLVSVELSSVNDTCITHVFCRHCICMLKSGSGREESVVKSTDGVKSDATAISEIVVAFADLPSGFRRIGPGVQPGDKLATVAHRPCGRNDALGPLHGCSSCITRCSSSIRPRVLRSTHYFRRFPVWLDRRPSSGDRNKPTILQLNVSSRPASEVR